jgi:hypothetical protein
LAVSFSQAWAQDTQTYAEKLGWKKGDRVVIMHVDDAAMSYDSDQGAIKAIEQGVATSVSVMMPCPWVPGFVHYLKDHPQMDAGLHLTLTSEWKDYRWAPLSGKPAVPGLVDPEGAMWHGVEDVAKHASPDEVETEIRAQVDRALTMGFTPTHLDTHMGTVYATPQFLERYIKVGIDKGIPVMLPGGHDTLLARDSKRGAADIANAQALGKKLWDAGLPVLDDLHNVSYGWKLPEGVEATDDNLRKMKTEKYIKAMHEMLPGVTMVIMHCTDPTEVFPKISDSGPTRKGDLLAMLDPALKKSIQDEKIILTTWRELKQRRDKVGKN